MVLVYDMVLGHFGRFHDIEKNLHLFFLPKSERNCVPGLNHAVHKMWFTHGSGLGRLTGPLQGLLGTPRQHQQLNTEIFEQVLR